MISRQLFRKERTTSSCHSSVSLSSHLLFPILTPTMAANAEAAVTQGALSAIYNNQPAENPVFQCVQLKPMGAGAGGVERYRLVWSDIRNYIQSMLATQLNHIVNEGKLKRGVFVRLKQFQQQEVKGKR
jgi:replication factor A1